VRAREARLPDPFPCLDAPGVRALLDHAHELATLPSAVEAIKENEQEFIVILRRR
jgi:hypothetical protein